MFGPGQGGASAYARVGVQTDVMSASPHRLIALLFAGARQAIAQARLYLQHGQIGMRGEAIGKAIRIVEEGLRGSLNLNAGGELAVRLDALYTYIGRRLLQANAEASEPMLAEADRLLATVEHGWNGIAAEAERIATRAA
jgi:flagellar secretion chaperone FliS